MSGYVDHAWRHRPKAMGGTDPLAVTDGICLAAMSKTGSAVAVATPWADQDVMIAWNSHSVAGLNSADHFAYTANVGDGNPGMQILTAGLYEFSWTIVVQPNSLATTNTGRLIPPFVQFSPIIARSGAGTFTGEPIVGNLYSYATSIWDSGVNERSAQNSNIASDAYPRVGGQESVLIRIGDANVPYTASCRFRAFDGAHDYSYGSPSLTIKRLLGDYEV